MRQESPEILDEARVNDPTQSPASIAADPAAQFESVLRFAAARGISDVHLKPHQRPLYRRQGVLISRRDEGLLEPEALLALAQVLIPATEQQIWQSRGQATFLLTLVGAGRFRVTVYLVRGLPTFAIRVIQPRVLSLRELNVPKVVQGWAMVPSGLVLVGSAPGSGQTSLWLGLLEAVNTASASARLLLTLEQPVEQVLDDKVAVIHQRELGRDVASVADGLELLARQDVDVLGLADLRQSDLPLALSAAEARCLVVASSAAGSAVGLVLKLLDAVPPERRSSFRHRLARVLRGVVWQTLVPGQDGRTQVPAFEVLVNCAPVQEFLRSDREIDGLQALVDSQQGRQLGMISLEQSMMDLLQSGAATAEALLSRARDPESLRARLAGVRTTGPVVALPVGQPSSTGVAAFAPLGSLPQRPSELSASRDPFRP